MAPERSPGRIPLDDIRTEAPYSQAAAGKDKKRDNRLESDNKGHGDESRGSKKSLDLAEESGFTKADSPTAAPPVPPKRHNAPLPAGDTAQPSNLHQGDPRLSSSLEDDFQDEFSLSRPNKSTLAKRKPQDFDISTSDDLVKASFSPQHPPQSNGPVTSPSTSSSGTVEASGKTADQETDMARPRNAHSEEMPKDIHSLTKEVEKLRSEKHFLQEQLSDAQSHIFSLQPYRKDLTTEEVGREYDDLVEQIQDWAQKTMDPWLHDHAAGAEEIASRKRSADALRFKKALHKYPDLVHASMFPETDEDIIVGLILRFLHDHIFQQILYGTLHNYMEVISFIENGLQSTVEPKRDLFSVRNWTAEAYNALLSASQFKAVRARRRKDLTLDLACTLRVFCKKDKFPSFCEGLDMSCVWPAMKLYEKLLVSTHHFYLDVNSFIAWGSNSNFVASPEFVDTVAKLDCRNVLRNRKAVNFAKLDPPPSKRELYQELLNVCTVVPALSMRQIGQRDAIKTPTVVRRQQMLVAWGPEEKRVKFCENGDRPLASHIYFAKSEKASEGWTAPFRWT